MNLQNLDSFSSKIDRKLDNTLGVYLSINGYSPNAVQEHSNNRPKLILMDGADLMAVLESRIDFVALLRRKKQNAARTGNIFLRYSEF